MTYNLTIDKNLMDHADWATSMATLKRWKAEGKVALIEADGAAKPAAYGWPGAPPKAAPSTGRGRHKVKSKGNVAFREVAAAVFPHKDAQKLDMGEINGVAHLLQHLNSHNEFFVTSNLKDFIADGKRDRLKGSFGIIALTPDEAVKVISNIEGWK